MKCLILGRTNVGKSSLFNRIIKRRKALVFNEAGITRDILKEIVVYEDSRFEIMDSGGFPEEVSSELEDKVQKKILSSMEEADAFIFVADAKQGVHSKDKEILNSVRKTGKPFLFFLNKVDDQENPEIHESEFFNLSSELLSGSCEKNLGITPVLKWITDLKKSPDFQQKKRLKKTLKTSNSADLVKLFVVGKANSGKSLLCNQILNKDRMIVSALAGTTLDTVEDFFTKDKEAYSICDNPGSRRGTRAEKEKLSFVKSRSQLDEADIVLLVSDGTQGLSRQEARWVELCLKSQKPIILILNKWDLVKDQKEDLEEQVKKYFRFYSDIPFVFMSAKTGENKEKLFKLISHIKKKMHTHIPTPQLNQFFMQVIRKAPSPVYGNSDVKFFYITQTKKTPPSFIAFANHPKGVTPSYKRFVMERIKRQWNLKGIPIQLHVLSRS